MKTHSSQVPDETQLQTIQPKHIEEHEENCSEKMSDFPTCTGRVTGAKYLTFPEGHRATLVAGMDEMLHYALLFVCAESKPRLEKMTKISGSYQPVALRQMVDDYLAADPERQKFLISGCFVAALGEKCGSGSV